MKIEWNKVTWYSKTLAMVLFVGAVIVAFYLGREFQAETMNIAGTQEQVFECSEQPLLGNEDLYTEIMVPLVEVDNNVLYDLGEIKFVPYLVPKTSALLTAVYEELFTWKSHTDYYDSKAGDISIVNGVGLQRRTFFDRVIIDASGTAALYLEGELDADFTHTPNMEFYYFQRQIEAAAFQFETVERLDVYINGEVVNWCNYPRDADDEEAGCGEFGPNLWSANKI